MPANYSTSFAKNIIERALRSIVDPHPTRGQLRKCRLHFSNRCAYCDTDLETPGRSVHVDHLAPASKGGRNHISNRVVCCDRCNAELKRGMHWEEFLQVLTSDDHERGVRVQKIREWIESWPSPPEPLSNHDERTLETAIDEAKRSFDAATETVGSISSRHHGM